MRQCLYFFSYRVEIAVMIACERLISVPSKPINCIDDPSARAYKYNEYSMNII